MDLLGIFTFTFSVLSITGITSGLLVEVLLLLGTEDGSLINVVGESLNSLRSKEFIKLFVQSHELVLLGGVGLGIDDELCIVSADGLVGGRLASVLVGILVGL